LRFANINRVEPEGLDAVFIFVEAIACGRVVFEENLIICEKIR
jgi:hypothetical protein